MVAIETTRPHVFCARCSDEIASRDALITVLQLPEIVEAFHTECYAREAQGWNPRRTPLNSAAMIWLIIAFAIICLVLFVISGWNPIFVVLACIVPVLRLLSWALVERLIPS